ncbi:hypothetical protein PGB90_003749 [Kerria lacca]
MKHTSLVRFSTYCPNSMEEKLILDEVKKLVALMIRISMQHVRYFQSFRLK